MKTGTGASSATAASCPSCCSKSDVAAAVARFREDRLRHISATLGMFGGVLEDESQE
jgi:hypothetical protein